VAQAQVAGHLYLPVLADSPGRYTVLRSVQGWRMQAREAISFMVRGLLRKVSQQNWDRLLAMTFNDIL
jgi:hypothetical protein